MGILYNRLLAVINDENPDSTYYHIALCMLRMIDTLHELSIIQLAMLCSVSKSTISKFIRYIGYADFSEFRYAAPFRVNRYHSEIEYISNVMNYIENNSMSALIKAFQADLKATFEKLDWEIVDRLVADLYSHKKVGVFGHDFSETAALDFQLKLAYNKKFVVTNINDLKQTHFILNAKENTLIIIFSDSGRYINRYLQIEDIYDKSIFSQTRAKVVLITSNPEMEHDSRVDYCLLFQRTESVRTHRIVYGALTDILAYKYREYQKKKSI